MILKTFAKLLFASLLPRHALGTLTYGATVTAIWDATSGHAPEKLIDGKFGPLSAS